VNDQYGSIFVTLIQFCTIMDVKVWLQPDTFNREMTSTVYSLQHPVIICIEGEGTSFWFTNSSKKITDLQGQCL
jgi:hypothetical protein